MKKTIALTFTLLFTMAFALTQASLASQEGEMMMKKKADKPAKATTAPKTDAEIQKCISDKFAASKTIADGAAAVTNGDATLTGEAKAAAPRAARQGRPKHGAKNGD